MKWVQMPQMDFVPITAGYGGGGSESYAGQWAEEDGFADDIFWATKVNVAGRGGEENGGGASGLSPGGG